MAEQIEMLAGLWTRRAEWIGGDAALCQITVTTCYYYTTLCITTTATTVLPLNTSCGKRLHFHKV